MEMIIEAISLVGPSIEEGINDCNHLKETDLVDDSLHELTEIAISTIKSSGELAQIPLIIELCDEVASIPNNSYTDSQSPLTLSDFVKFGNWIKSLENLARGDSSQEVENGLVDIFADEKRNEIRNKIHTYLESSNSEFVNGSPEFSNSNGSEIFSSDDSVDTEFDKAPVNTFAEDAQQEKPDDVAGAELPDSTKIPSSDLIELFDQDLSEIEDEMDSLCIQFCDLEIDQEERKKAITLYANQLNRLSEAFLMAESLGLLKAIGILVEILSVVSESQELTSKNIGRWNPMFRKYLREGPKSEVALDITLLMQSLAEVDQLSETEADDLYNLLSNNFGFVVIDSDENPRPQVANVDDVTLEIDPDVTGNVVNSFLLEAPLLAAEFSSLISELETDSSDVERLVASQRAIHTLKGVSSLVGVKGISNIAHLIEDVLEFLVSTESNCPPLLAETLMEASDTIEGMLDYLNSNGELPPQMFEVYSEILEWAILCDGDAIGNHQHLLQVNEDRKTKGNLASELRSTDAADPEKVQSETLIEDETSAQWGGETAIEPETFPQNQATNLVDLPPEKALSNAGIEKQTFTEPETKVDRLEEEMLQLPVSIVERIFHVVGELSVSIGQVQLQTGKVLQQSIDARKNHRVVEQKQFDLENAVDVRSMLKRKFEIDEKTPVNEADFDPLEMDEFDQLHSASHAYIETVSDVSLMVNTIESSARALQNILNEQKQLNSELQESVTKLRLVSASTLSARFKRCVRQAARSTNKKVDFSILHSDTQVNSETLNKLVNPILHILRNAVDHGIEDMDTRIAKQKPEDGQLSLSFSTDGKTITVVCDDDGAGIEYKKVLEKAIEHGYVSDVDSVEHEDLNRFLLLPGFSTREQTTQLSGRGIGMDVVNQMVKDLNGDLVISNNDWGGCRIEIQIPVLMVTTNALLVEIGDDQFSIPRTMFDQVLSQNMGSLERVGDTWTFYFSNEAFPVIFLGDELNIKRRSTNSDGTSGVLLANTSVGMVAVIVDRVLDNNNLVVKSMGNYLVGAFDHVYGVAVLGDGRLICVLNLLSIVSNSQRKSPVPRVALRDDSDTMMDEITKILIVDDSLSVRTSLSDLVEDAGFVPVLAKDGMEALEMMKSNNIGVVLTDLEMPRMDGLELTRRIRTGVTPELPILMITSRTMQKHQEQANLSGVTKYITKPFSESEVIADLEALMA